MHTRSARPLVVLCFLTVLAVTVAACGTSSSKSSGTAASPASGTAASSAVQPVTLRLGYFPNVTHAPALVGIQNGTFQKDLGASVKLKLSVFNAGPAAVEALFAGALDASFVGPNPAINAYQKSGGKAIRIVAGAASGGAFLVVKPSINGPADLKGKTLASPQLGGTQDVALRTWLKGNGLSTTTSGGGDVKILPQDNSTTLDAFKAGSIDGAWVPEPWATRLVNEGGGKVLVNEASLWPGGKFVTTELMVSTKFLDAHPDVVKGLIEGLADSVALIKNQPAEAQRLVAQAIQHASGKPIAAALVAASFAHIQFTLDPLAASLRTSAQHAEALGLLKPIDLGGIFDLTILDQVLEARGQAGVST